MFYIIALAKQVKIKLKTGLQSSWRRPLTRVLELSSPRKMLGKIKKIPLGFINGILGDEYC